MKKSVMVLALGAMLGSCGGGDASEKAALENAIEEVAKIDTAIINTPCACAEAFIPVYDASIVATNQIIQLSKDTDDTEDPEFQKKGKDLMKKVQVIQTKMMEVALRCMDDLYPANAGDDCKAKKVYLEKAMAAAEAEQAMREETNRR